MRCPAQAPSTTATATVGVDRQVRHSTGDRRRSGFQDHQAGANWTRSPASRAVAADRCDLEVTHRGLSGRQTSTAPAGIDLSWSSGPAGTEAIPSQGLDLAGSASAERRLLPSPAAAVVDEYPCPAAVSLDHPVVVLEVDGPGAPRVPSRLTRPARWSGSAESLRVFRLEAAGSCITLFE